MNQLSRSLESLTPPSVQAQAEAHDPVAKQLLGENWIQAKPLLLGTVIPKVKLVRFETV